MNVLKKNIILSFSIGLLIVSIVCGVFGYYGAVRMQTTQGQQDELPWVLEPSATYSHIEATDAVDRFIATLSESEERVIIDSSGKVIEKLPGTETFDHGFYTYKDGDNYGVKNSDEKLIVPADYSYIHANGNYFVGFGADGEPSIWNNKGDCLYTESKSAEVSYLTDDLFYIMQTDSATADKSRAYFLHAESQKKQTASWGDVDFVNIFSDGRGGYIGESGVYFSLNENFEIIENGPMYDIFGEISEGLRYVQVYDQTTAAVTPCYIDEDGEVKITLDNHEIPDVAGPFSEGKAFVQTGNQLVCIDTEGTERFAFEVKHSNSNSLLHFYDTFVYSNDFAAITLDGDKYGYIDETGEFIVPTVLDAAEEVEYGYAPAAIYNNGYHYGILKIGE